MPPHRHVSRRGALTLVAVLLVIALLVNMAVVIRTAAMREDVPCVVTVQTTCMVITSSGRGVNYLNRYGIPMVATVTPPVPTATGRP